jgi:hypothetical protein
MNNKQKTQITITLDDRELLALTDLMKKKKMTESQILKQAFRTYQSIELKIEQGEKVFVDSSTPPIGLDKLD